MLVTAQEIKQIDQFAIHQLGIPSLTLMERAAQHVTHAVLEEGQGKSPFRVAVICGYGNNGGDGLACARQLLNAGASVLTILVGNADKITPDAATNMQKLVEVGGEILEVSLTSAAFPKEKLVGMDCLVDALFGVGLSRKVEGIYAKTIEAMQSAKAPVICVDVPSGLNSDTGEVMGCCVKGKTTITFTAMKHGLTQGAGPEHAGEVKVGDIGIPMDEVQKFLEKNENK